MNLSRKGNETQKIIARWGREREKEWDKYLSLLSSSSTRSNIAHFSQEIARSLCRQVQFNLEFIEIFSYSFRYYFYEFPHLSKEKKIV